MYKKLSVPLFTAVLLSIAGCKKDKGIETMVFISTGEVTNVTSISATGSGDADVAGAQSITERGICWNTNPKPTIDNNKAVADGTGTGHFSANIMGLTSGTVYYARAYVINNGQPYYGKDVKFSASVPVELIKNGDFELPADTVTQINSLENWRTDDAGPNLGRGIDDYWGYQNYFWTNDWSKSIYQVIGTVPSSASDYAIKFDRNWDWTDWNDYKPTIAVIFSAYDGDDSTTRKPIDTVKFVEPNFFPGYGNNWATKSGTFSIPAASAFAGQKLVIELDVLPYDDGSSGYDPNLWFDFDNVSVIQTLK
ncbi:MAG TPA: hypothetical protein VH396_08115 [Chitinophagaceae bacterium]|jgi:hypothetical protein